jgi:hypothetical protein
MTTWGHPMVDWLSCSKCKTLVALVNGPQMNCSACGSPGEIVSKEHVKEGVEAGAYYNLATGKGSKKRPS